MNAARSGRAAVHVFALCLGLNYGIELIPLIEQYTYDFD